MKTITLDILRETFNINVFKPSGLEWSNTRPKSHFADLGDYDRYMTMWADRMAGSLVEKNKNYFVVRAFGRGWFCHRVVYMLSRGVLLGPDDEVDHRDGNSENNHPKNLRLCTHNQNMANSKLSKNNTTGYKGVSSGKNKLNPYVAHIGYNGKKIFLGCFASAEKAAAAYESEAKKLFGEFARTE